MKKLLSAFLAIVMLLSITAGISVSAYADSEMHTSGDYEYYVIDEKEKTCFISRYNGNGTVLDIPTSIDGYTVTRIGGLMLELNTTVTSVKIPGTVETLDQWAFGAHEKLESVEICEGVKSIGTQCFTSCKQLKNIKIPKSIEYVGEWAFQDTKYYDNENNWKNGGLYFGNILVAVKEDYEGKLQIENGTTTIGHSTLCKYLTTHNNKSIIVPDSVKFINYDALGYKYGEHIGIHEKIDGFTIYGFKGTEAERYATDNGFKFLALNKLEDKSGISVVENEIDALDSNATLNVVNKETTANKLVYDITLTKNGKEIQPSGKVTVKIPVSAEFGEDAKVYREETNGKYTDMNAVYSNGYMIFTTNHFSRYIVTTNDLNNESSTETDKPENNKPDENKPAENKPESKPESTTKPNTSKKSPNTGASTIALAILCATGAGAVLIKKRNEF